MSYEKFFILIFLNRQQGFLLLKTTLIVRAHQPELYFSHGWKLFTDNVFKIINKNKKKNYIAIAWK